MHENRLTRQKAGTNAHTQNKREQRRPIKMTERRSEHFPEATLRSLQNMAERLRLDALEMIHRRGAGHPGGSLSAAEIVACLFFHSLKIDPANPGWEERDRFILSKGHASALLYAALARKGYFPTSDLEKWGDLDCHLQGHPDILKTPGVDMTSGILGHGIAIGAGLCIAGKMKHKDYQVYTLLGDGEIQGGIIWEGAMLAAKYRCGKLTAFLDYNDVQLDGFVHDIMPLEPLVSKWQAFNWHVIEIDGHNIQEILAAIESAREVTELPTMIIAHTIKGKGVSFMENKAKWHGNAPTKQELKFARQEIEGRL
jgi:transketolase